MKTPEERLTRGKGNFINCTDYDDAIKAMKEYAIEYHEQQVKNLNIPAVINSDCLHNQFCDKQTIDMKCKSESGCNFKVQSDL